MAPLDNVVAPNLVVRALRLHEKVTWPTALAPQYNPICTASLAAVALNELKQSAQAVPPFARH